MTTNYFYKNSKSKFLEISGQDSLPFIQNLITNDINKCKENHFLYSCLLTPQGKFLTDFFIFKNNEKFIFEVHDNFYEDFLQKLNIQMDKVIMAHIERTIVEEEELKKVAATGCYLEYDLFGHENSFYPLDPKTPMPNDFQRLTQIQKLIDLGHLNQILIAQDICSKHRLTQYGGHGYHHIIQNIIPRMRLMNFTAKTIKTITINNPINILQF